MCLRALGTHGGPRLADNTPGERRTRSRYHHAVSINIEAPVDCAGSRKITQGKRDKGGI